MGIGKGLCMVGWLVCCGEGAEVELQLVLLTSTILVEK